MLKKGKTISCFVTSECMRAVLLVPSRSGILCVGGDDCPGPVTLHKVEGPRSHRRIKCINSFIKSSKKEKTKSFLLGLLPQVPQ